MYSLALSLAIVSTPVLPVDVPIIAGAINAEYAYDNGADFAMPYDPFDYCAPIVWGHVSEREWNDFLYMGWTGRVSDRMEALYPPACHAPSE